MNFKKINILLTLLTLTSCKKRNSQDGGLLDEPATHQPPQSGAALHGEALAPGGVWQIICLPTEHNLTQKYRIDITGATSEIDESQLIKISIEKLTQAPMPAGAARLANQEFGHGAVAAHGAIFIGFTGGALTADFNKSLAKHDGLLTLVDDKDASGLSVQCEANAVRSTTVKSDPPATGP